MKGKRLLSGILGILLVFGLLFVTACPTDSGDDGTNNGQNNGNNEGNNGDNTDTRGFLDILYGEAGVARPGGDPNEGVYVGIISFADDARVIAEPILLNATGYNTLKSKIANDYTRATVGSTSMFIAVHKALSELKSKENTYPANLDTVSIITFTDGLDNRSLALLANSSNASGP